MKKATAVLLLLLAASQAGARQIAVPPPGTVREGASHRVLLIVAHPDDEYEVAGTVYRITKELSGTVDQVIITDGEGGFRYSLLAGRYYKFDLTNEPVGRKKLPGIREREARRAGNILGIRHQWFLHEPDEHFTLDAEEVLQKSWNTKRVLSSVV
jgi:N-acetylglucosamine malate deacetylase 2